MVLGKSTFPPEGENNLPVCVEGEGRLCIMEFVPDLWGGGVTFFFTSCIYLVDVDMVVLDERTVGRSLLPPSTT